MVMIAHIEAHTEDGQTVTVTGHVLSTDGATIPVNYQTDMATADLMFSMAVEMGVV